MPDNLLGTVLGEDDEALVLRAGRCETRLVPPKLRLRREGPAALGFYDDVEPGGSQLDVGEPAIGLVVRLELDD